MGTVAERLWRELEAVYEAAGKPTLARLVALGGEQRPPCKVADSTIHGWLKGVTVPGPSQTRFFLVLVQFLQSKAVEAGSGHVARSEGQWQQWLTRARAEQPRGGRPRTARPTALLPGPVTLPPAPAEFTGRTQPLEEVLNRLDPGCEQTQAAVVVSAVAGMGGVGKTALALQAAHQARKRGWFPGGILFADLRGYSPGTELDAGAVADQFLRAFGVKAKDLPATLGEKLDAWRLRLDGLGADRPLLVVLDNARTAGQIAPLLPAAPHRALVTSRQTLSALPASRIDLAPLDPADALDLLNQALGADDDRATDQLTDAQRLVELCGYLPLALRIIAALLRDEPQRPLADQVVDLADARTRLDVLDYDDVDDQGRPLAVRATFDLSYRHLTGEQARAFRLLAAAPGPDISTVGAAVLIERPATRRLLTDLARAHLLQRASSDPDRWSMHDLVRLFADEHGRAHAETDRRDAALKHLLDHYTFTAEAAHTHLRSLPGRPVHESFTSEEHALGWLDGERANLVTAVRTAQHLGHPRVAIGLPLALATYLNQRRYFDDCIAITTIARDTADALDDQHNEASAWNYLALALKDVRRFDEATTACERAISIRQALGDRHGEAAAWSNLGGVLKEVRRFDEAIAANHRALAISQVLGDRHGEAVGWNNLGSVLQEVRRFDEAIAAHHQAGDIYREVGDRLFEATVWLNLGNLLPQVRRFEEAITACERARDMSQALGDRHGEGMAWNNLGNALAEVRRFGEAIGATQQALEISQALGDRHGEAKAWNNLGSTLIDDGQAEEAVTAYERARDLYRELGDRYREADACSSLGGALAMVHRYEEAIAVCERARDVLQALGERHSEAVAWNNLGHALRHVDKPHEAITAYEHARDAFADLGDRQYEAMAWNNLGHAQRQLDRFDEAVKAWECARGRYHDLGLCELEATTLNLLGNTLLQADRFDEAIAICQRAYDTFRNIDDRHGEAGALANLGTALAMVGRTDDAVAAYEETVACCRAIGESSIEAVAWHMLAAVHSSTGRAAQARAARLAAATADARAKTGGKAKQARRQRRKNPRPAKKRRRKG